ncbi:integrin-linked kinase-associated serine/threonine phosphatase 2C isoform X4 [Gasterosteus aculeatus]
MDLFDDLPEPRQTSGRVSSATTARPQATTEEEEEEDEEEKKRLKRRREDTEEEGEVKRVCLPVLKGYVAARRGERDEMQDAHVLLPDMSSYLNARPSPASRVSYFAVFDGHGGARASRFAAEHLHHILANKFPSGLTGNMDVLIKRCLLDTFRQTDEDFLRTASSQKPAWKDGSTATCVLAVDDTVYVANLGDSRAVLCRMEAAAAGGGRRSLTLPLSTEHNPTIYEERRRIQRAGGTVRDGRVLGVLEVSRSIGDGSSCWPVTGSSKSFLLRKPLSSCFTSCSAFSPHFLPLQEATVEQKPGLTEEEVRSEAACQRLASEAVRRGCADNVTVILLSISF